MQKEKYCVIELSRGSEVNAIGYELVRETSPNLLMLRAVYPYNGRLYINRSDIGDTVYRGKEEALMNLDNLKEMTKLCGKTLYCYTTRMGFTTLRECIVLQVLGPYITVRGKRDSLDTYKLFRLLDIGKLLYESPQDAKNFLAECETDLYLIEDVEIKTIGRDKVRRRALGTRVFTDLACASTRKAFDEDSFAYKGGKSGW